MTTTLGVDTTSRIDPHALLTGGYTIICRYLSNSSWKNLVMGSPPFDAEARSYIDNGVGLVLNWESSGQIGNGYSQGRIDALAAQNQADKMELGTAPIYFSIDYDLQPAAYPNLDSYLAGISSVIPKSRIGVYAGYYVLKHLFDAALITYGWQTKAWSGGNVDPRTHMLQRIGTVTVGGAACDVNEIRQPYVGQTPFNGATNVGPRIIQNRTTMDRLIPSPAPADPKSLPSTWPTVNDTIYFDLAGGWEGECAVAFGVQDWGARADHQAGYLRLASWLTRGGADIQYTPVNSVYSTDGLGAAIIRHYPTEAFTAPKGAVGITFNYSAPAGAGISIGRSA